MGNKALKPPTRVLNSEKPKLPKCSVTMKDKVKPVPCSVNGPERDRTGTCPVCNTPGVALSVVGEYIRVHVIAQDMIPANNPQPATLVAEPALSDHPHTSNKRGKALTEHRAEMTDSGLRVGSPRDTDKRRGHTMDGAYGRGTVKVPVTVPPKNGKGKGRTKLEDAPATEDNVRAALAYWKARKPRTPEAHKRQTDMIAEMYRRLDGMRQAPGTYRAGKTDRAGANRGPALIPGRHETPRTRSPKKPWTEPTDLRRNGEVRKVTSLEQPRGHDRFDPSILTVPEPEPELSRSQKRRNRRKRTRTRYVAQLIRAGQ